MNEEERSRIEELQERLYSRSKASSRKKEFSFHTSDIRVPESWYVEDEEKGLIIAPKKHMSIGTKILLGAGGFFVLSLFVAGFVYVRGGNVISVNNVNIDILAPTSVGGGEEFPLEVIITNNNSTALEFADLRIEYPEGAKNPQDVTEEQKRTHKEIGAISEGGEAKVSDRVVLFGEENAKKKIIAIIEYRVRGSNAIFEKRKEIELAITSAPVSLKVESLKEVNSGQDMEFVVDVVSNSSAPIENVLLRSEYAFGFKFKEATPKSTFDANVWLIGTLDPGEKRTIKIRGTMEGQDNEERSFRFLVGSQNRRNDKQLEPIFLTSTHTVTIKRPFLGVTLALDGTTQPLYPARVQREIRADITYVNNLPTAIYDAEIVLKFEGGILNKTSVRVERGFYRSVDNTVIWNKSTNEVLSTLEPGESGRVSMSFSSGAVTPDTVSLFRNPEISLEVSVRGRRTSDLNVPEEILSTVVRKVRLMTALSVAPVALYSSGPFQNRGPIPPRAEDETTYTITWTVTNTLNDTSDVKVSAEVPTYVKWLNVTVPTGESVVYNPTGGVVIWNVGEVPAGTGFTSAPRQASFQISFVPSVSQIGTIPELLRETNIVGRDRFSDSFIQQTRNVLTTRIVSDPAYRERDEYVVR